MWNLSKITVQILKTYVRFESPYPDGLIADPVIFQGQMRYDVKWKGYEKKADRTWETEDNLQ